MRALTSQKAVCGVGTGGDPDARTAAETALAGALAPLGEAMPDLVLVYASVRYDLETVVSTVAKTAGGAVVAGATTSGQLHCGTLTPPGAGVAVLALAGGGYRFGLGYASGVRADPVGTGRSLARDARAEAGPSPHAAVLLFSDGLAGDQQGLLTGVHSVAGFAVPVIGGAAGDDRALAETFVFAGDQVLTDSAVAVWIAAERPLRVHCAHGWHPTGLPLLVTGLDGPVIRELDGRPALTVYRESFSDDPASRFPTVRAGGYHPARALGLIQPDGSVVMRTAVLGDDGTVSTLSPVPPYAAVRVMACDADELLRVADETGAAAVADRDAAVVLVFSCVARLDALGPRGPEEARRVQRAAGAVPTFGFYTFGEFARSAGVAGYHNATIAAMAL